MGSSTLFATERVIPGPCTSATAGQIVWVPSKAIWFAGHGIAGLVGVVFFPSIAAVLVFVVLMAVTICAGHSVGMHRLLIHKSFQTYRVVFYVLVWLGTLVGMAGPFGMMKAHDMRDWHQRQTECPPHPAHKAGFWKDAFWQLMCEFRLETPPRFVIEADLERDRFLRFVERTWMLQQVPVALLLYLIGGWGWVLWGVCLRVFVSLAGHWAVGHFAHKSGEATWVIKGLPVQGYNLPRLWLITFGENWHGNHHAFPYSAKLGVGEDEFDPGFWFILVLRRLELAWNVQEPGMQPARDGLAQV